jgi:integrase
MARAVRNAIGNRTQRQRLEARKEPYWAVLEKGLSVGYHRSTRGGGTWWARALVEGRYRSESIGATDDNQDADGDRYLDFGQAQRAAREWADRQTSTGPLTVRAVCEIYIEGIRAAKGERPAYHAASVIKRHILPKLGGERASELTTEKLRRWHHGLVKRTGGDVDQEAERRSRDTANRILTVLKAALNRAFEDGLVKDDRPWRALKAFKAVGEARQIVLLAGELQWLVDACPDGLRELVAAGAYTGARLGELMSARVRDFDAKNRTLAVRGKTGSRFIHLDAGASALFAKAAHGRAGADPLLRTADGGPWTPSLHLRPVAAAVAAAKLDPATTFYALRHSYVTHALNAGVPIKAVAEHCGTSVVMISRTYAKVLAGDRGRYAAMGAPSLTVERIAGTDRNVVAFGR